MNTIVAMNGRPDPLENFRNAASSIDSIDDLVASTRRAFLHIEPWAHAQTVSVHPTVRETILAVKGHAIVYFTAIDMSIKTSQDGVSFAEDAISLCEAIVDEAPLSYILTFIDDMQQVAQRAHQGAQDMLEKFRTVRRGFFEITNKISHSSDQVFRQTQKAQASQRRHERGGAIAGTISQATMEAGNFLGAAAGALSFGHGHLAIVVPAVLPFISFIASRIEHGCMYKAEARRTEVLSCREAATQLERISGDMESLLKHINGFSTWWLNIYTVLNSLKANVAHLRSEHLDLDRVKGIQRKWFKVQEQYHMYGIEISKLQDFYPTLYLRSRSHLSDGLSIRIEPTVSSLAVKVGQCQAVIHALHTTSLNARGRYSAPLRGCLDDIERHLKSEWASLLDHLQLVVDFGHDVADAYDHPDSSAQCLDAARWVETLDGLSKTSQAIADRHATVRNVFASHKDTISKGMVKSASSWRAKRLRHATRESLASTSANSSDDDHDGPRTDYIGNRLDLLQDDGLKVLESFEMILTDIGSCLRDMASFWRVRSIGSSTKLSSSSSSTVLRGQTLTICDVEPINQLSISASAESITASFDALVVDIPSITLPTNGVKDNKARFLPHLREWRRT